MKVNRNRGFSLVELIVAFAIFAIAGIAVTGFVSFSSKTFSNSNSQLKLQYEQQVVINNIRDAIVKTTRGISFNDATDTLLVLSESGVADTPVLATQYRLDGATNELKMAEKKFSIDGLEEGVEPNITFAASDEEPLSDSMTGFDVDLTEVNNNRVTLHAAFKVGDKEVEVHPVIALRNNGEELSLQGDGLDDAEYGDYEGFEISAVKQVVIYKDGEHVTSVVMPLKGNEGSVSTTKMKLDAVVQKNPVYTGAFIDGVNWTIDNATVKNGYENYFIISDGILTVNPVYKSRKYNIPSSYIANGEYITIIATSKQDSTKIAKVNVSFKVGGIFPVSIKEVNAKTKWNSDDELGYDSSAEYISIDYTSNNLIYNTSYTIKYSNNTTKSKADALDAIKLVSCKTDTGETPPEGAGFGSIKFDGKFYITHDMASKTYNVELQSKENDENGNVVQYKYKIICPPLEEFPDKSGKFTMPILTLLTEGELKRGQDISFNIDWTTFIPTSYNFKGTKTYYEIEVNSLQNTCGNWEKNDNSRFGNTIILKNDNDPSEFIPSQQPQKIVISEDKIKETKGRETFSLKATPYLDWNARFTLQVTMRIRMGGEKVKIGEVTRGAFPIYWTEDIYDYKYNPNGVYFRPYRGLLDAILQQNYSVTDEFVITKQLVFDPVTMTLEEVETNPLPASYEGIVNTSHTIGLGKKTNEPAVEGEKDIITDKPLTNRVLYDYYKVFKPTFTALYVTPDNYADYVHLTLHNSTDSGESPIRPYYYNQGERNWTRNVVGTAIGMVPTEKELYFYGMMSPVKWYKKTATFPIGAKMSMRVGDNKGNAINATFVQDGKRLDYIDYKVKFEYEK